MDTLTSDEITVVSDQPMLCLPFDLPVALLELTFRARGPVTAPAFLPGFWRSVFGRAAKVMETLGRLEMAPRRAGGLFGELFAETSGGQEPRAYVLRAPVMADRATFAPGEPLRFELVLIGPAINEMRSFVQAFILAGELGLGTERQEAMLEHLAYVVPGMESWQPLPVDAESFDAIEGATPIPVYDPPGRIDLDIWSPLALKRDGKVLKADEIEASTLLRSLMRRVRSLAALGDPSLATFPLAELNHLADQTQITRHQLVDAKPLIRHSRHEDSYVIEGVVGRAELDLSAAPELWPWLVLVPWIHAGRATTMGAGGIGLYHADGHPIG